MKDSNDINIYFEKNKNVYRFKSYDKLKNVIIYFNYFYYSRLKNA